MEQSLRSSKYVKDDVPNCSVVQIREGKVYVFQTELYYTIDSEIDYSKDKVTFYPMDSIHSLNQAPETISQQKTLHIPLNIAFDILEAFKELEKENEQRLSRLFT